jgi:hypothetical protein
VTFPRVLLSTYILLLVEFILVFEEHIFVVMLIILVGLIVVVMLIIPDGDRVVDVALAVLRPTVVHRHFV